MADNKKIAFGTTAGIATAVAAILGAVYKDEGGYVNHSSDPGGETNMGVTKVVAVESGYKGPMKAFPKQCVTASEVCADKIYYESYMLKPGYVPLIKLDAAVGEEIVNTAVNMGPKRPGTWLQQSLNELCPSLPGKALLVTDGKVGAGTVAYFESCQTTVTKATFCLKMLDKLDNKQRLEYDRLVRINPKLKVFYKGWVSHRIGNVDRRKCEG